MISERRSSSEMRIGDLMSAAATTKINGSDLKCGKATI